MKYSTPSPLRGMGVSESNTRSGVDDAVWPGDWAAATLHAAPSGAVSLCRRDRAGRSEPVAPLSAGQPLEIPAGRSYRPWVVEPGDLLAITPPTRTQNQPVLTKRTEKRTESCRPVRNQ